MFLLVAALAAGAIAAGVALARTGPAPIGTGVVVINTTAAYQGGVAAGTGMVLTSSGEVLTNNHVIRGATSIKVVIPGTKHAYTARVDGYDVADDVAVLRAVGASHLKTVSTAASAKLESARQCGLSATRTAPADWPPPADRLPVCASRSPSATIPAAPRASAG